MLVFRNTGLEHEHCVDGGAILQVFEEKIGFWQSSCVSLPFLGSDGFLFEGYCANHTCLCCGVTGCYKNCL